MNEDIKTAERILNGLLSEEFTPAVLVTALHNVLACGKGHKKAEFDLLRADDEPFESMMDGLGKASKSARKIEE